MKRRESTSQRLGASHNLFRKLDPGPSLNARNDPGFTSLASVVLFRSDLTNYRASITAQGITIRLTKQDDVSTVLILANRPTVKSAPVLTPCSIEVADRDGGGTTLPVTV